MLSMCVQLKGITFLMISGRKEGMVRGVNVVTHTLEIDDRRPVGVGMHDGKH